MTESAIAVEHRMTRPRVALVGLGMVIVPQAKSALDLCDEVEAALAFSPAAAAGRMK